MRHAPFSDYVEYNSYVYVIFLRNKRKRICDYCSRKRQKKIYSSKLIRMQGVNVAKIEYARLEVKISTSQADQNIECRVTKTICFKASDEIQ